MGRLADEARPILIPLDRRNGFKLAQDWTYGTFTVPKGFITDLDSIPKIPYLYSLFKGRASWSAVIHDYLYHSGEVSRKSADDLFLLDMKKERIGWLYRHLIYLAVRTFGWLAWNRYRKLTTCNKCGNGSDDCPH